MLGKAHPVEILHANCLQYTAPRPVALNIFGVHTALTELQWVSIQFSNALKSAECDTHTQLHRMGRTTVVFFADLRIFINKLSNKLIEFVFNKAITNFWWVNEGFESTTEKVDKIGTFVFFSHR